MRFNLRSNPPWGKSGKEWYWLGKKPRRTKIEQRLKEGWSPRTSFFKLSSKGIPFGAFRHWRKFFRK